MFIVETAQDESSSVGAACYMDIFPAKDVGNDKRVSGGLQIFRSWRSEQHAGSVRIITHIHICKFSGAKGPQAGLNITYNPSSLFSVEAMTSSSCPS
ncbi:MAG: hypothetical protein HZA50_14615 [Planctomycetes bacterium]|nr:hypothetical protein [Planctomycetota bacterium]